MKTQITAVVAVLFASGAFSAFGQYVLFVGGHNTVYDDFTTPGTGVVALGNVDVAFVWAAAGTTDPLGPGVPATGFNSGAAGAGVSGLIYQMLGDGWTEGYNYNGGSPVEAAVAVTGVGPDKGAFLYNGTNPFQLNGATPGDAYEIVVVGWDNMGGAVNSLDAALTDGGALGWSNSFTYQTGATATAPIVSFTASGMTPFGVAPAPEPTILAFIGLGGLSMLYFRRRL